MGLKRALPAVCSLIVILSLAVSGCATAPAPTPSPTPGPQPKPEPVVLKWDMFWGPDYRALVEAEKPCAEAIEKESDGRIKFDIYYAQSLLKGTEGYEGVAAGVGDICLTFPTYEAGKMLATDVMNLPFALPKPDKIDDIAKVRADLAANLFDKYGKTEIDPRVTVLSLPSLCDYRIMTAKKKVTSLSDWKGLNIRTPGGAGTEILKSLGTIPVTMLPGDLAQALQTGVLDGVFHTYAAQWGWGSWEFLSYSVDMTISGGVGLFLINTKKWESLPADLQQIISKNFSKYCPNVAIAYFSDDRDRFSQMHIEEVVLPQTEKDKIANATLPAWQVWQADATKKGLDAKAIIRGLADEWKKAGFTAPESWAKMGE